MFLKGKKHGVGIECNEKENKKFISIYEHDRLIFRKEINKLDELDNEFLDVKRKQFSNEYEKYDQ